MDRINDDAHYTCPNCGRLVPSINRVIHTIRCCRQQNETSSQLSHSSTLPYDSTNEDSSFEASRDLASSSYSLPSDQTFQSSSNNWNCIRCTFLNNYLNSVCEMCETPRGNSFNMNNLNRNDGCEQSRHGGATWTCEACTAINMRSVASCEICDTPRPPDASYRDTLIDDLPQSPIETSSASSNNYYSFTDSYVPIGLALGALGGLGLAMASGRSVSSSMLTGASIGALSGSMYDSYQILNNSSRNNDSSSPSTSTSNIRTSSSENYSNNDTNSNMHRRIRIRREEDPFNNLMMTMLMDQGQRGVMFNNGQIITFINSIDNDSNIRMNYDELLARFGDGSNRPASMSAINALPSRQYFRADNNHNNNSSSSPTNENITLTTPPPPTTTTNYEEQTETSKKKKRDIVDTTGIINNSNVNNNNNNNDDSCGICLECYQNQEMIKTLPCLHSFHTKCIDKWLSHCGNCPICKRNI